MMEIENKEHTNISNNGKEKLAKVIAIL